ncbi:MAG: hypothetical protein V1921_05175 [Candidatus Altiarchaeota archaeon]
MAKKITFLAKTKVKKRVSFRSGGRKISFTAKLPSRRRKRVTFYAR